VTGTTSTFGDQGMDTTSGIENLIGTTETDEFTGGDEDNYFMSHGGVDEVLGGGGEDLIESLGGADIVDGGDSHDAIVYAAAPRPVTADLASGFANGHGGDTLLGVEDVIGSRWPDILRGSEVRNLFLGGDGGDILEGTAGDDVLDGNLAFDTLDGGEGTDDCVEGESQLDCEGNNMAPDAVALSIHFTTFQALLLKWRATEEAMQDAPAFP
jgi:Ca2+-binding RTX toxin-like protein